MGVILTATSPPPLVRIRENPVGGHAGNDLCGRIRHESDEAPNHNHPIRIGQTGPGVTKGNEWDVSRGRKFARPGNGRHPISLRVIVAAPGDSCRAMSRGEVPVAPTFAKPRAAWRSPRVPCSIRPAARSCVAAEPVILPPQLPMPTILAQLDAGFRAAIRDAFDIDA